jgi:methyl-accepting chemotaxis protein
LLQEQTDKLNALSRSMAAIEFDMTGKVLTANDNFLNTLGYTLNEVQGKHHRLFVEANYANSSEYAQFWQRLNQGEFFAERFKRIGKGGKVVWIEASYNPIFDADGKPYKVVKYASDVTANENNKIELERAVASARNVLLDMSKGNLTRRVEGSFSGQLLELQSAINNMADKLSGIVQSVSSSAFVVNDASAQISQGSSDLSARAQDQASALEESSATMHQMTSAVQTNTENARKAADLTRQVQQQSVEGVAVMNDTISAMKAIQTSSNKIADIVTLIDSIAFQTNLLALNAAVEAARAGEHGRGFAVVASEVRALAGKSADAAKDIKTLITDSVSRIENGTQLADKSGEMLNGISASIEQVAGMVDQIATASNEQATGINQVHRAMSDIDRVTQENAALVEETTAAAESLTTEANNLRNEMAFFKTGQSVGTNLSVRAAAKPAVKASVGANPRGRPALPAPKKSNGEEWGEF